MTGFWLGAMDIIPNELWTLDTELRDVSWSGQKVILRGIEVSLGENHDYLNVTPTFEPIAPGVVGLTDTYPGAVQCQGNVAGGTESSPSDEAAPDDVEGDGPIPPTALIVFSDTSVHKRILPNEDEWTELITGESGILHGKINPWWTIENNTYDPTFLEYSYCGSGFIKDVIGLAGEPVEVTPITGPPNTWSDGIPPTAGNVDYMAIFFDTMQQDTSYILIRYQAAGAWRGWLMQRVAGSDSYLPLYDGVTLPAEAKPLWIAICPLHILVTVWHDDTLKLLVFDKGIFTYNSEHDLGDASEAQLDSMERVAIPLEMQQYSDTAPDANSPFVVIGRMNDPVGLSGIVNAVQYDGSWSEVIVYDENGIEEDLGTDWLAAGLVGVSDDSREFWALRETT
jgi:hypothetical protein